MKHNYTPFNKCIFRTPVYNFSQRNQVREHIGYDFKEALYLASLDFYNERINTSKQGKANDKFEQSLYKYAYRACSRCTPFGLFAGCSIAEISDKTDITLDDSCRYRRVTRLDMNYMCALVQKIEQQKFIRKQLSYYPNDSIYTLGGAYRYVEYYYSGVKRVHKISSVDFNDYLKTILDYAANGENHAQIVNHIVDEEITTEEAYEFIEELIDSQLLKSDLELSVTGDDALSVLIKKLATLQGTENITDPLIKINELLKQINSSQIGTTIQLYEEITEELKRLEVVYDPKYLFQTDVFKPTIKAEISDTIIDDICSTVTFLNKITPRNKKGSLAEFKKAFSNKYEDREVPLLEVMDTELGVGSMYTGSTDANELLKDVRFENRNQQAAETEIGNLTGFLLKKYVECIKNNSETIILTDDDLNKKAEVSWKDTPITISVMCSLIRSDNKENLIYLKSAGGSCAANLLGRFCHLDNEIEEITKAITEKEKQFYKDFIVAEIVHLPESRIGNILFRPILREYEIHYLAHPAVEQDFKIPASDLYVSLKGDRVVLFSKKLNKEIIPRLTTAHNFSFNSSPVYQFLCELQYQDITGGFGFNWSSPFEYLDYRPRVIYKNCILSRRQWKLTMDDFDESEQKEVEKFGKKLEQIIEIRGIPQYGIISESDNELLIDFKDATAVQVFYSYLKKRKALWIDEFLFEENNPVIKDKEGNSFCNELIVLFHKNPVL